MKKIMNFASRWKSTAWGISSNFNYLKETLSVFEAYLIGF
jgi:hypothetical protein